MTEHDHTVQLGAADGQQTSGNCLAPEAWNFRQGRRAATWFNLPLVSRLFSRLLGRMACS
jgi:hypothetical protein